MSGNCASQNLLTNRAFSMTGVSNFSMPRTIWAESVLFRYCRLVLRAGELQARHDECRLSHAEMAELERLSEYAA